jgi:hypothetical protein
MMKKSPSKPNMNDERKRHAQDRIRAAVKHLTQQGIFPRAVGARIALMRTTTKELFGMTISDATLKKRENLPLWHPKHQPEEPKVLGFDDKL